jgi:hypothetical protein
MVPLLWLAYLIVPVVGFLARSRCAFHSGGVSQAARRLEGEAIASAFLDATDALALPLRLRVPREFGECSQVECGYDHCVALNYTGGVCAWGGSLFSQNGRWQETLLVVVGD